MKATWGEQRSLESNRSDSSTVDIIFTGDFCFGNRTEALCEQGNYAKIYNDTLSLLRAKDISVTNLECPLTLKRNPITKDGPHLGADPQCVGALRFAGFDVAALANNHILDHGAAGLLDTMHVCNGAGIKTVGAGKDLSTASKPLIVNVKGYNIAFLNFAEHEFSIANRDSAGANPLDLVSNYYQIVKAKKQADLIFVVVHGGNEHYSLPSPRMVQTFRFFADLGVTAVIGHHPHCASGFEIYNNVPLFYSLGNFVFDSKSLENVSWYKGYFVRFSIKEGSVGTISLFPYLQFKDTLGARLMNEGEEAEYSSSIEELSQIIQDNEKLEGAWEDFCRADSYYYLKHLFGFNKLQRILFKVAGRYRLFPHTSRAVGLLNLIQCEAHRDVSIKTLERVTRDQH